MNRSLQIKVTFPPCWLLFKLAKMLKAPKRPLFLLLQTLNRDTSLSISNRYHFEGIYITWHPCGYCCKVWEKKFFSILK